MTKNRIFILFFMLMSFSSLLYAQAEKQEAVAPQVIFKLNGNVVPNFTIVKKGDRPNLSIKGEGDKVGYRFNNIEIYLLTQQKDGSLNREKVGGADVSSRDAVGNGIDIPLPSHALRMPEKYDSVEIQWDKILRVDYQGSPLASKPSPIENTGGSISLRIKK